MFTISKRQTYESKMRTAVLSYFKTHGATRWSTAREAICVKLLTRCTTMDDVRFKVTIFMGDLVREGTLSRKNNMVRLKRR